MMRNSQAVGGCGFIGADVHAPVDVARVGGDDLAADFGRESHGIRRLAGCGRSDDDNECRSVSHTSNTSMPSGEHEISSHVTIMIFKIAIRGRGVLHRKIRLLADVIRGYLDTMTGLRHLMSCCVYF